MNHIPISTPPGTYPDALYHRQPNAMGAGFARDFIEWTAANSEHFVQGGDGANRRDVEYVGPDDPFLDPFRELLLDSYRGALDACHVPEFDVDWTELNVIGFLNFDRFGWHTDQFQSSLNLREETKALTFIYYAHTQPREFDGGGLRFEDGTIIEPDNDLLLWIHPDQPHQVDTVYARGADVWRCGRWTISGWLHRPERGELPTWDLEPGAPRPVPGEGSHVRDPAEYATVRHQPEAKPG